jgi:hypothetical protein
MNSEQLYNVGDVVQIVTILAQKTIGNVAFVREAHWANCATGWLYGVQYESLNGELVRLLCYDFELKRIEGEPS